MSVSFPVISFRFQVFLYFFKHVFLFTWHIYVSVQQKLSYIYQFSGIRFFFGMDDSFRGIYVNSLVGFFSVINFPVNFS